MRRSRSTLAALAVGASLVLAGCGGGDDTEAAGDATAAADGAVTFVGTGSVAWESTDVEAVATDGTLEVTIVCEGAVPHNIIIEGVNGGESIAECAGDDEGTATVDIEPGTYAFWCDIAGHREAGMEGELTVS